MSRRNFSFSSTKLAISPTKVLSKPPSSKHSNLSETKSTLNKLSSSSITISFISNLYLKLKEKYSSPAQGLKKLAEQYPVEIPILQFRNILQDLKLNYTEKEFKDFFRIYGKTQKSSGFVGITIEALTKCIHSSPTVKKNVSPIQKHSNLLKTLNFSTRASSKILDESKSRLNFSMSSPKCGLQEGVKVNKAEGFLEHLMRIFYSAEEAVEYFFVDRGDFIGFEEFFMSVKGLGLEKVYLDMQEVFLELSSEEQITRKAFFWSIFEVGCKDKSFNQVLSEFRDRVINSFGSYFQAFQELTEGNSFLTQSSITKAAARVNMSKEKDVIIELLSEQYPGCQLYFKDFKRFWVGKDGVCSIKSCEEIPLEFFSYCKTHIQCLANRGEEIYTKLQIIMKKTQLLNLIQDVLKEEKTKLFVVNGFELHKKDSLALKEFLKLHGFNKRPASSSVKSRVNS